MLSRLKVLSGAACLVVVSTLWLASSIAPRWLRCNVGTTGLTIQMTSRCVRSYFVPLLDQGEIPVELHSFLGFEVAAIHIPKRDDGDQIIWIAVPFWALFGLSAAFPAISGARRARRWRRRTHGLCIRCGYDLRGSVSDLCSECGTPVRNSTIA